MARMQAKSRGCDLSVGAVACIQTLVFFRLRVSAFSTKVGSFSEPSLERSD